MLMTWFTACAVFVHTTSQLYDGDPCVDSETSVAGRCCPVRACASAADDLREKKRNPTLCSFSGHTPVVCCRRGCSPDPDRDPDPDPDPDPDRDRDPLGQPGRLFGAPRTSEQMCSEYDKIGVYTAPSAGAGAGAGAGAAAGTGAGSGVRIRRDFSIQAVGGEDTQVDEFPHMAAVGWPLKNGGYAFNCGGSLISNKFVLTAGHCLSNPRDTSLTVAEPTIVRLGDRNILDGIEDGAAPSDVLISTRIKHPNYRPPMKYFDIALLELQTTVSFSDHIKPACLWTNSSFSSYTSAVVTGWGTTVSGGRKNSEVLQKVTVDILDTAVCQPLLQNSQNRNWQGFQDNQLCAGVLAGGKDACQGDSGGPLQIKAQGFRKKLYVIGVTSFGRECGKRNQPGVYSRVSSFLDWIEPIVWPEQ